MQKVLFIDRDGTIIVEPRDEQVDNFEEFEFLPKAITCLSKIAGELDFEMVMVTNQDGLGTESYPEETFWPVHNKMLQILRGEGVIFKEILIDRTFKYENAPTRKPGTGMLTDYINGNYDLKNSFVIGDRVTDIQLAKNLGCKAIYINTKDSEDVALTTKDWNEIYLFLKNWSRISSIFRRTTETDIAIEVNLDGTGKAFIDTGLGFFDHMLQQIAKHGNIDLSIKSRGDIEIDEHHTIEDVAIALGNAFLEALGNKKGINRYGFVLPMDDCLAQVAIDFGGRPWLVWDAVFTREKVGEMPTEMFMHFFKSFSDSAKCNLNIKAEGTNEHHKIEAIFKAFAKAVNMAKTKNGDDTIPSTKGNL
jgi:imidazoleglycerol-phosphate dehydratase / histidinol-phosphatase